LSKFGTELLKSAREAVAIASGKAKSARKYRVASVDVAALRKKLGLSQTVFAERFGLSAATVRDWEQGRRFPDRTARTLLAVIAKTPGAVTSAVKSSAPRAAE
jgi:putative transcriptional regulator